MSNMDEDKEKMMQKLLKMKKELAKKTKKLEKAKRAAQAKAHVRQKIKEHDEMEKSFHTPSGCTNTQMSTSSGKHDLEVPLKASCTIEPSTVKSIATTTNVKNSLSQNENVKTVEIKTKEDDEQSQKNETSNNDFKPSIFATDPQIDKASVSHGGNTPSTVLFDSKALIHNHNKFNTECSGKTQSNVKYVAKATQEEEKIITDVSVRDKHTSLLHKSVDEPKKIKAHNDGLVRKISQISTHFESKSKDKILNEKQIKKPGLQNSCMDSTDLKRKSKWIDIEDFKDDANTAKKLSKDSMQEDIAPHRNGNSWLSTVKMKSNNKQTPLHAKKTVGNNSNLKKERPSSQAEAKEKKDHHSVSSHSSKDLSGSITVGINMQGGDNHLKACSSQNTNSAKEVKCRDSQCSKEVGSTVNQTQTDSSSQVSKQEDSKVQNSPKSQASATELQEFWQCIHEDLGTVLRGVQGTKEKKLTEREDVDTVLGSVQGTKSKTMSDSKDLGTVLGGDLEAKEKIRNIRKDQGFVLSGLTSTKDKTMSDRNDLDSVLSNVQETKEKIVSNNGDAPILTVQDSTCPISADSLNKVGTENQTSQESHYQDLTPSFRTQISSSKAAPTDNAVVSCNTVSDSEFLNILGISGTERRGAEDKSCVKDEKCYDIPMQERDKCETKINEDLSHGKQKTKQYPSEGKILKSMNMANKGQETNSSSQQTLEFTDYTEMDFIQFSHFELSEDFLSEGTQSQSSTQSSKSKNAGPIVKRRSGRISSAKRDHLETSSSQSSLVDTIASTPVLEEKLSPLLSSPVLSRRTKCRRKSLAQQRKAAAVLSVFQFLKDKAKEPGSESEFSLPSSFDDLKNNSTQKPLEICDTDNKDNKTMPPSTEESSTTLVLLDERNLTEINNKDTAGKCDLSVDKPKDISVFSDTSNKYEFSKDACTTKVHPKTMSSKSITIDENTNVSNNLNTDGMHILTQPKYEIPIAAETVPCQPCSQSQTLEPSKMLDVDKMSKVKTCSDYLIIEETEDPTGYTVTSPTHCSVNLGVLKKSLVQIPNENLELSQEKTTPCDPDNSASTLVDKISNQEKIEKETYNIGKSEKQDVHIKHIGENMCKSNTKEEKLPSEEKETDCLTTHSTPKSSKSNQQKELSDKKCTSPSSLQKNATAELFLSPSNNASNIADSLLSPVVPVKDKSSPHGFRFLSRKSISFTSTPKPSSRTRSYSQGQFEADGVSPVTHKTAVSGRPEYQAHSSQEQGVHKHPLSTSACNKSLSLLFSPEISKNALINRETSDAASPFQTSQINIDISNSSLVPECDESYPSPAQIQRDSLSLSITHHDAGAEISSNDTTLMSPLGVNMSYPADRSLMDVSKTSSITSPQPWKKLARTASTPVQVIESEASTGCQSGSFSFTPNRGKLRGASQSKYSGNSNLKFSGCFQSDSQDAVVDLLCGSVRNNTDVDGPGQMYIVSVQATSITVWGQDPTLGWTTELFWQLAPETHILRACLLPRSAMVSVLVTGWVGSNPLASVLTYNWETEDTHRLNISFDDVLVEKSSCSQLQVEPCSAPDNILYLGMSTESRHSIMRVVLAEDSRTLESSLVFEWRQSRILNLVLVEGQASALLVLSSDQKLTLWNCTSGSALKSTHIPVTLPCVVGLVAAVARRGLLFIDVMWRVDSDGSCGGLVVMNPLNGRIKVIHKYKVPNSSWRRVETYRKNGNFITGLNDRGALCVWDRRSGSTRGCSKSNISTCAAVSRGSLLVGEIHGCMHIYGQQQRN